MLFRPLKYVPYLYISTSRCICAVPNMAVVCSPLISCSDILCIIFEMVAVAPLTTGVTFYFYEPHALNFLPYGLVHGCFLDHISVP